MALRVWLPLNGNPNKVDNLSDLVKNIGTDGSIVLTRVGSHHSFVSGGKLGYALNLMGAASDYLYMPGLKLQTFSWACWFKCTGSTTATSQRILSEGRDTGSRGAEIWISQDSTTLYLQAHGVTHTTTIAPNKWYHVAFTCGDGVFSSYLNGNLINFSAYTADCDYAQSNDKFVIGKMAYNYTNTSNYFPFVGRINDVRIYDHCLSVKEVKEISQGLILHYKLDGFSGGAGENILTGTNYNSYSSSLNATTATNANGKWCGGSGGNGTFSVTEDFTCPVGNLSWNISNNTSGNRDFQQGNQPYVSGQQYTTSFWAKGNGTCLYRSWNSTDGKQMFSKTWTLTTDWAYYTHTFTASAEMETDLCTFHLGVTGNSNISICGMKMEKGSIATAWSPAPQDFGIDTSKITDSSGYGNDGIIFGNVTTKVNDSNEGRYGISTYIPLGSTDFIGTWDSIGNPSDAITMSIWFKSSNTSPGNGYHEIFNHANSSQYFEFAIQNTGLFRGGMVINGTRYVANTAQLGLLDGNWHMLSMTYDGATIVRYVDGISRSTTSVTGELTGADGVFLFGHYGPNTSYYAKEAYLADARIYATALSAEDILDLYHTPANIDNLGGIHGFEMVEDGDKQNINEKGQVVNNGNTKTYLVNNFSETNSMTDWSFGGSPTISNGVVTMTGVNPAFNSSNFTVNPNDIIVVEFDIQMPTISTTTSGPGVYIGTPTGSANSVTQFSYNFTTQSWTVGSTNNTNPYFMNSYNSTDYYHCRTYLLGSNRTIDDLPPAEATNTRTLYALKLNSATTAKIRSGYNSNTTMTIKLSNFKIYKLDNEGFCETDDIAKVGKGYYQATQFIEK